MVSAITRRRGVTGAVIVGAIVVALTLTSPGSARHRIFLAVPDATNIVPGQDVRAAGQKIGSVEAMKSLDKGRTVRLALSISNAAWPLPHGTKMAFRWGGTISYVNRYIAVQRGADGRPPLPEGATLSTADIDVPTELDQFLATFTPSTRTDLGRLVTNGGAALQLARPHLQRALHTAPAALVQTSAVLADLTANRTALDTLTRSTSNVVDAVQRADPGLTPLIQGAARTFRAVSGRSIQLQTTLDLAARTLAQTEGTLRRGRGTLTSASQVAARLGPGVEQLRRIASPLNEVLGTVQAIGPNARATLRTVRQSAPNLNGLLHRGRRDLPKVGSLSQQSTTALSCVRPYAPEIAGFFSNWADFLSFSDGKDKFLRAQVQNLLPAGSNASNQTSAEAKQSFPGLEYGFPRPPGTNAGQPWFLPECGAGKDALDPAQDPETRPLGSYPGLPLTELPSGLLK